MRVIHHAPALFSREGMDSRGKMHVDCSCYICATWWCDMWHLCQLPYVWQHHTGYTRISEKWGLKAYLHLQLMTIDTAKRWMKRMPETEMFKITIVAELLLNKAKSTDYIAYRSPHNCWHKRGTHFPKKWQTLLERQSQIGRQWDVYKSVCFSLHAHLIFHDCCCSRFSLDQIWMNNWPRV